MADQKPLLKLEMKDVVLIKPSKSPPSSILSLSTLDQRPDLNYLGQIVHVYRSAIHDSDLLEDPVLVFKEALSKALVYYYPLAGRLVKHADGKLRVHCSEEYGVPFIETIANCDLSTIHYLDGADTEIAKQLVFDLPSQDERGQQYPLVIKVTKFLCGGLTIGLGMSHSIADGFGASQFFRAVIELANGRIEPSLKPVWEREKLVGSTTEQPLPNPMNKACATVSPFVVPNGETAFSQACFKVNREIITRLKLGLMKESVKTSVKESFTDFESLVAYVWRSRARALEQSTNGKTMLSIVVGSRRRLLDSPLPDGYYGNAIVDAYVVLTVRELNERPLSEVVKLIRKAKHEAITGDYIKNFINTLETKKEMIDTSLEEMGAAMAPTEWMHTSFGEDIDFGGMEAVNLVPVPHDMFKSVATCIFSPPNKLDDPSMKGGVRIFTTLPVDARPKFREEMEALKLILNHSKL